TRSTSISQRNASASTAPEPRSWPEARLAETRQIEPFVAGAFDRGVVARVGVAHDAAGRIIPEHARDPLRRFRRTVGDDHHAGMLGIADTDAAAMVQRDPGRAA